MANEIIKINNEMTGKPLRMTAVESDFLMAIIWKVQGTGSNEHKFTFGEVKKLSKYAGKDESQFFNDLCNTQEKFARLLYAKKDDNSYLTLPLFSMYFTDKKTQTVTVQVNKHMTYILNDWFDEGRFTPLLMDDYLELRSKYTKALYRQLRRYRTTGRYYAKIEDFREVLDVPKSYNIDKITNRILIPALEELGGLFVGLRYEFEKHGKGKAFTHIVFRFQKQPKEYGNYSREQQPDTKNKAEKIADIETKKKAGTATPEMIALQSHIKRELKHKQDNGYPDELSVTPPKAKKAGLFSSLFGK